MEPTSPEVATDEIPAEGLPGQAGVGVGVDELAAIYVLDAVKGFGPQKFKQLHEQGISFADIVRDPATLPIKGKKGDALRAQLVAEVDRLIPECRSRAERQIQSAGRLRARLVTYKSASYPQNVYRSNNPVPVLYVRGSEEALTGASVVACVGSRKIRSPYLELHRAFARRACAAGLAISSGFALGADSVGHLAARESGGQTICCMPCGLDRPFPPENKQIWEDFLTYPGAVFVSEFSFGTRASSLTLRKRNKLIVAFAQRVLVSQSSEDGGAMNAYRFAREQKKPVATFESDSQPDTSGNAKIAGARRPGDEVFPINAADDGRYEAWLRGPSSST